MQSSVHKHNTAKAAPQDFNFSDLIVEFSKLCPDYYESVSLNRLSPSLEFSCQFLFDVAPYVSDNRIYRFPFKNGALLVSTCEVTLTGQPKFEHNSLSLTLQQAELLAVHIFNEVIPLSFALGYIMLTPMAKVIFNQDVLKNIVSDLGYNKNEKANFANIIRCINASCQFGGQYLEHSESHVAACALLAITKDMKNRALAASIISTTLKQYQIKGKQFNKELFCVFAKYVTGGIPADLSSKLLIAQPLPQLKWQLRMRVKVVSGKKDTKPTTSSSALRIPVTPDTKNISIDEIQSLAEALHISETKSTLAE